MNFQQKEVANYLAIGSEALFTRPLHFAIRKDVPNADRIIQQFNAEIKEMIGDGSYNRILNLNWIQADVDGDGQLEMVLNGDKAGLKAHQTVTVYIFRIQITRQRIGSGIISMVSL